MGKKEMKRISDSSVVQSRESDRLLTLTKHVLKASEIFVHLIQLLPIHLKLTHVGSVY